MGRTLEELDKAFDHHLISADQKEKAMNKRFDEMHSTNSGLHEEVRGLRQDIKPVIEFFNSTRIVNNFFKTLLKGFAWTIAVSGGIAGLIYTIKKIMGK